MNIWEIPFAAVTICPIAGISPLNAEFNSSDSSRLNALHSFSGDIEKRITDAKWRNTKSESGELFTEIATAEGFCFTFNMMNFYDLFEDDV